MFKILIIRWHLDYKFVKNFPKYIYIKFLNKILLNIQNKQLIFLRTICKLQTNLDKT